MIERTHSKWLNGETFAMAPMSLPELNNQKKLAIDLAKRWNIYGPDWERIK